MWKRCYATGEAVTINSNHPLSKTTVSRPTMSEESFRGLPVSQLFPEEKEGWRGWVQSPMVRYTFCSSIVHILV